MKVINFLSFLFLGFLIIGPQTLQAADLETSFDFRFRYEFTDDDSKLEKRRRSRIRTRLGAQYSPYKDFIIKIRFATAEANTTSANQTLGHDFTLSDIGMDQLFIDYNLSDNSSVALGKISNPFFKPNKSQLLFDGDYNPKGVSLNIDRDDYFANIGLFKFDEHSSKAIDIRGFQIGLNNKLSSQTSFKLALAQYNFDNIKGRPASEVTWNGKVFGNPVDTNDNYLNNYNVTNLSAEIKTKLGGSSIPTTIFLDVARNSKADQEDTGFLIGMKLTLNDLWKVTYLYKDVENNAVFGAIVDSNFGGGGVGHKGHQLNISYSFSKKFSIELTWFDNQNKMNIDYNKMFIDFKYKL